MNNEHFRKLVSSTPRATSSSGSASSQKDAASAGPTLGSRQKAFIPMTPRSIGGGGGSVDFAKQLAVHRAAQNSQKKDKKFKSSAPLGSKFAEGYVDRAKARSEDHVDGDETGEDDREKRLRALVELAKEGKIDNDVVVEQSRLFGGDVSSTHLVKGLDFQLLKRVKKGEDVFNGKKRETDDDEREEEENLDDVLDQVLEKDVVPVAKEEKKKTQEEPQRKLTRAEILANLKKSQQEAAAKAQPVLGSKFKKIGDSKKPKASMLPPPPPPKEEAHPKKKRKTEVAAAPSEKEKKRKESTAGVVAEKKSSTVMGMLPEELPQGAFATGSTATADAEDDDEDIFAGAGVDYDPLAGLHDDDSDSDSSDDGEIKSKEKPPPPPPDEMAPPPPPPPKEEDMPPPPPQPSGRRNYFGTSASGDSTSVSDAPLSAAPRMTTSELLASNPELAAAIKKASTLNPLDDPNSEEAKRAAKHKAMLESVNRDDEDLDMGFGESRTFADDDEDEGGGGGGKSSKKRGKKKKKE